MGFLALLDLLIDRAEHLLAHHETFPHSSCPSWLRIEVVADAAVIGMATEVVSEFNAECACVVQPGSNARSFSNYRGGQCASPWPGRPTLGSRRQPSRSASSPSAIPRSIRIGCRRGPRLPVRARHANDLRDALPGDQGD